MTPPNSLIPPDSGAARRIRQAGATAPTSRQTPVTFLNKSDKSKGVPDGRA